jgi:hypothetical protein
MHGCDEVLLEAIKEKLSCDKKRMDDFRVVQQVFDISKTFLRMSYPYSL